MPSDVAAHESPPGEAPSTMRILMMIEATAGGIRKHVVDLLFGLRTRGHELSFVYSLRRSDSVFRDVLPILAERGIQLQAVDLDCNLHPFEDTCAFLAVVRAIRAFRPDVAHAHGAKAGFLLRPAAWTCGVRTIVYNPHGGAFHRFARRGGIYLLAEKLLSHVRQTYIGVSRQARDQIIQSLGIAPESVLLIHNGIDLSQYPRAERVFEPQSDLIVLYPAIFSENKGHLEFLDAIARSPVKLDGRVRILLAGSGPLAPLIEQRIKALHMEGSIRMLGFVSDMVSRFKECDLVLVPSRNEVFGYVAVEALAIGRPVIATNVGALPDIVQDRVNGRIVDRGRLGEIVGLLNDFAAHRAALSALAGDDRARLAALFDVDVMVGATERAYGSPASNRAGTAEARPAPRRAV